MEEEYLAKGTLDRAYHHRYYKLQSADDLAGSRSWKSDSNGVWNPIQCHMGISADINVCASIISTLESFSTNCVNSSVKRRKR